MRINAVVPVAQFEPDSVIIKSIECLKELECDNFTLKICYVIDSVPGDKRNLHCTLPDNFKILLRAPRGRKAGKLNDFLRMSENADYIAIFDVDSRPASDYVVKCVAALEEDDSAVLSQGYRVVNNMNNVLTKIASFEFNFLFDMNQVLSHSHGFLAFMGPMVIRRSFFDGEKFDEEAMDETFDLITRMYVTGKTTVLAKTTLGEQAPSTLKDIYNQRVRWHRGMMQSFSRYLVPMVKAPIPFTRKMSWLSIIIFSITDFLFSPVVLFRVDRIAKLSDGPFEFFMLFVGSIGYSWLKTICGFVALAQHLTSKKPEWKSPMRSDV